MVDTINELSDLSRKLNQESDKINPTIEAINKKLAALNIGLETWLDDEVESGEFRRLDDGQFDSLPRKKFVVYLGYDKVDDKWQLATKEGWLTEDVNEDRELTSMLNDVCYDSLLRASRQVRVRALSLVPRLLDSLKDKAEGALRAIAEAEKAAEKL